MIKPFARYGAIVVGSAALLWGASALAAEMAVTVCQPNPSNIRSIVAAQKALAAGRPILAQRASVETNRIASLPRERQDPDKKYSDVPWYRRQMVLLVGVGY